MEHTNNRQQAKAEAREAKDAAKAAAKAEGQAVETKEETAETKAEREQSDLKKSLVKNNGSISKVLSDRKTEKGSEAPIGIASNVARALTDLENVDCSDGITLTSTDKNAGNKSLHALLNGLGNAPDPTAPISTVVEGFDASKNSSGGFGHPNNTANLIREAEQNPKGVTIIGLDYSSYGDETKVCATVSSNGKLMRITGKEMGALTKAPGGLTEESLAAFIDTNGISLDLVKEYASHTKGQNILSSDNYAASLTKVVIQENSPVGMAENGDILFGAAGQIRIPVEAVSSFSVSEKGTISIEFINANVYGDDEKNVKTIGQDLFERGDRETFLELFTDEAGAGGREHMAKYFDSYQKVKLGTDDVSKKEAATLKKGLGNLIQDKLQIIAKIPGVSSFSDQFGKQTVTNLVATSLTNGSTNGSNQAKVVDSAKKVLSEDQQSAIVLAHGNVIIALHNVITEKGSPVIEKTEEKLSEVKDSMDMGKDDPTQTDPTQTDPTETEPTPIQ